MVLWHFPKARSADQEFVLLGTSSNVGVKGGECSLNQLVKKNPDVDILLFYKFCLIILSSALEGLCWVAMQFYFTFVVHLPVDGSVLVSLEL